MIAVNVAPSGCGLQLRQDLFVCRKLAGLVFAVDVGPVDFDVEDASGAFDEFGTSSGVGFDGVRQTGGFRQVVSLSAVSNRDWHQ